MPDPSLEKKKLNIKEVGIRGAIVHFWTYYKWWVIIPVICIAIITSLVTSYLSATRKAYLNIAMVNARYEGGKVVFAGFAEKVGKELIIDSTYHAPTNEDSIDVSQDMTISMQKLVTSISGGVVDVVVTNSRSIKEFGENGVRDLRTVLSPEQIAELERREILFYLDFEAEAHVPVAINVTGMKIFEPAYEGSEEKHYLFFSAFSDKTEEEKLLAEYLFFEDHDQ
ncbi:MAG: hypothetical protein IKD90_12565 [Clostridiales bacterium]|nr:hypothetical protein [Clostridiales bacterium]